VCIFVEGYNYDRYRYEVTMVSGFRYLEWCRMQTVQFRHDCFLSRESVAADIPSWHIMKRR
jgi:hypothetical protein